MAVFSPFADRAKHDAFPGFTPEEAVFFKGVVQSGNVGKIFASCLLQNTNKHGPRLHLSGPDHHPRSVFPREKRSPFRGIGNVGSEK